MIGVWVFNNYWNVVGSIKYKFVFFNYLMSIYCIVVVSGGNNKVVVVNVFFFKESKEIVNCIIN